MRVVNQLLTEMDGLEARKQVFIMGATNRPGEIQDTKWLPSPMGNLDVTQGKSSLGDWGRAFSPLCPSSSVFWLFA